METNIRTEAQQAASRTNGAKSQGAVTEEGKARSSQNARKHDFFTKVGLLPDEDQQEYYDIAEAFLDEHKPQTVTERFYVLEMANAIFRLQRVRRYAAEIQSKAAEDMTEAFEKLADEGKLQLCLRYERHFQRQFDTAIKMILSLRRSVKQSAQGQQIKDLAFQVKVMHRAIFGPPQPGENPAFDELFQHAQQQNASRRNEPGIGL